MRVVRLYKYIWNKYKRYRYNKKNHCNINSRFASLNSVYGYRSRIDRGVYVNENCKIGDFTYINKNSSVENAEIGRYCSISSGVYIGPYEHGLNYISTSPVIQPRTILKGVKIGNDVLISLNAIILDGVTVGDGAVIGAGAVVTHDVEPYEVVGGVPAKHIKYRFEERIINKLIESEWYDKEPEKIVELQNEIFT